MKKYQSVARKIAEYIKSNQLKQGTKLPKITDLMERFKVGKSTILQALTLLDQEGVVYKVQGSGIFVRRPAKEGYMTLGADWGFASTFTDKIKKVDVSVKEVPYPPLELAKGIFPIEPCYKVMRTIIAGENILLREESYYLKKEIPFLTQEIAEGSIFGYIIQGLGLEIRFADQYMRVRGLTKQEAAALHLKEGDPTLQIKEVHYLASGQPFDLAKLVYNYQNVKFINQSPDKMI